MNYYCHHNLINSYLLYYSTWNMKVFHSLWFDPLKLVSGFPNESCHCPTDLICSLICSSVRWSRAITPSITSFSFNSSSSTSSCTRSIATRFCLRHRHCSVVQKNGIYLKSKSPCCHFWSIWLCRSSKTLYISIVLYSEKYCTSQSDTVKSLGKVQSSFLRLFPHGSYKWWESQSPAPSPQTSGPVPASRIWCPGFSALKRRCKTRGQISKARIVYTLLWNYLK